MSLFFIPPYWSVQIPLTFIYYFTVFLFGHSFYFLFDLHNQIISVHITSLYMSSSILFSLYLSSQRLAFVDMQIVLNV